MGRPSLRQLPASVYILLYAVQATFVRPPSAANLRGNMRCGPARVVPGARRSGLLPVQISRLSFPSYPFSHPNIRLITLFPRINCTPVSSKIV